MDYFTPIKVGWIRPGFHERSCGSVGVGKPCNPSNELVFFKRSKVDQARKSLESPHEKACTLENGTAGTQSH